jgi:hypothetical protein
MGYTEMCTVPKVPRQCPLVLLVKFGWRQGGAVVSDDGKFGLLSVWSRGKKLGMWAGFCVLEGSVLTKFHNVGRTAF